MKTRAFLLGVLSLAVVTVRAQVLSNTVINAAGEHRVNSQLGISVTDNIGEPFTEPLGPVASMMITQGFLQPHINIGLIVTQNGLTCVDRNDGFISVAFSSLNNRHTEQYIWSPPSACPMGNCGNTVDNLMPGTYSLTIISTFTTNSGSTGNDTIRSGPIVIASSSEPCLVKVYSGVTPNSDNNNDTWFIENIEMFPNNRVSLYSRWGVLVYEESGYDNRTRVWPTSDQLPKLLSSTYFYIIELGDGSRPLKGWVELLKN